MHRDYYKEAEVEGSWILQGFSHFDIHGFYMKGVRLRSWIYGPKFDSATFFPPLFCHWCKIFPEKRVWRMFTLVLEVHPVELSVIATS